MTRYDGIDEKGYPILGARLQSGDCILGRTRIRKTAAGATTKENISLYVPVNDYMAIERVYIDHNESMNVIIRVKVRDVRMPTVGDRIASRHAQKCTISTIVPEEDMPFISSSCPYTNGLKPDLIINPHSIPSRMTLGKMIEFLAGSVGALTGKVMNSTAFRDMDIDDMGDVMEKFGLMRDGTQYMMTAPPASTSRRPYSSGPCTTSSCATWSSTRSRRAARAVWSPRRVSPPAVNR